MDVLKVKQEKSMQLATNFQTQVCESDFTDSELLVTLIIREVLNPARELKQMLGMVKELLQLRTVDSLSRNVRLAASIVVVGSGSVEFFETALQLLSCWDFVKNQFWVVEEEILRHMTFAKFEEYFEEIETGYDFSPDMISNSLTEVVKKNFPEVIPSFIGHPIVRNSCSSLREHFKIFISRLSSSAHPRAKLLEYQNTYPIERFIPWFLRWAKPLLDKYSTTDDTNLSRFKVDYSCREAPDVKIEPKDSEQTEDSKEEEQVASIHTLFSEKCQRSTTATYIPWLHTRRLEQETLTSSSNGSSEDTTEQVASPKSLQSTGVLNNSTLSPHDTPRARFFRSTAGFESST